MYSLLFTHRQRGDGCGHGARVAAERRRVQKGVVEVLLPHLPRADGGARGHNTASKCLTDRDDVRGEDMV